MIELQRRTGGFSFFKSGEQAVGQVRTELLMYLRDNAQQMEADARDVFIDRLGETLTKLDAVGYRRTVSLGNLVFATGR